MEALPYACRYLLRGKGANGAGRRLRPAGAAALKTGYSEGVKSRLAGSPPAALAARTAFKIAAATTSAA